MRADPFLAVDWTAEIGKTDAADATDAAIVRFVDLRGRSYYVALGRRVRRYVGTKAERDTPPSCDPAYHAATIH